MRSIARSRQAAALAVAILGLAGAASATGASPSQRGLAAAEPVPSVQVRAEFRAAVRATYYSVVNTGTAAGLRVDLPHARYGWILSPPEKDPDCDNWQITAGTGKRFVWHHGNKGDPVSDDFCSHKGLGEGGHLGTVRVTVEDENWKCHADYVGTEGDNGLPVGLGDAEPCKPQLLPPPPATQPPPPPPPPATTPPRCDVERAAVARARATQDAYWKAWQDARAAVLKLRPAWDAANAQYGSFGHIAATSITLGLNEVIGDSLDNWLAVGTAYDQALAVADALYVQYNKADKELTRASKALEDCLKGKPRVLARAAVAVACGAQIDALAAAQGLVSVYQEVSGSFARARFSAAVTRLDRAQAIATGAKAKLPSSPAAAKVARWLTTLAVDIGRASRALSDVDVVGSGYAANVAPAQRQVAVAQAALTACKK